MLFCVVVFIYCTAGSNYTTYSIVCVFCINELRSVSAILVSVAGFICTSFLPPSTYQLLLILSFSEAGLG